MEPRKKTGMALMLFGIVILSLGIIGSVISQITINIIVNEQETSQSIYFPTTGTLNDYYYCSGCYLDYELQSDGIWIIFENLTRNGIYSLFYGEFRIYDYNANSSTNTTWYSIYYSNWYDWISFSLFPNFGELEYIEMFLLEFPQKDINYILIREILILDKITIDLT